MAEESFSKRHEQMITDLQEEVVELRIQDGQNTTNWRRQHDWSKTTDDRVKALEMMAWKALGGGAILLLAGNLTFQWLMTRGGP